MSSVILGIDPGLATTGFGVLGSQTRDDHTVLQYGIITTLPNTPLYKRLQQLYEEISVLLVVNKPELVAVEQLFFGKNVKTAMDVGHARGVILLAVANQNIPIVEFTPLQVKMALTGYGRADKQQMQLLVQQLLKLPEIPKPDDAADAIAVALTAAVSHAIDR